ncbi:MAG: 50S ribosomal protein L11 [Candidatus Woesearchaeota archaeon]|nr:MAG: 50S ribosomal protein L11 [Candidatus Woesearchaeota archaeon]
MAEQSVDVLIEGGKATAAPPLGPALGPLGVNIGQVVVDINKKTADFKGMQVPIKVTVDTKTKAYEIKIGTPPAASLIKKEAGISKGSGIPNKEFMADLKIEQVIKIANMKADKLTGKDNEMRVREIIGTAQSMGILIEGKPAQEILKDLSPWRKQIQSGKSELSAEELKKLEEEKKAMQEQLAAKHAKEETEAKQIAESMKGKTRNAIKARMIEAGISDTIMNKYLPADDKK